MIEFSEFMRIPIIFCNIFGLVPYFNHNIIRANQKQIWLYWFSFTVLVTSAIGFILYFLQSDFSNFLQMTALAPCLGFCLLALIKMVTIWFNRDKLTMIMNGLETLFPTTRQEQNIYRVRKYMKETNYKMKLYAIIFMILIWIFNLVPYGVTVYKYLYTGIWIRQLPYFIWYPYNEYADYAFEFTYILQMWAGFVTVTAILSIDLLFCGVLTLVCMQFDILGKKLSNMNPSEATMVESNKDINDCVKVHYLLILISNEVENIYSPSLLINFIGSSLIICLVGFQATANDDYVELFKFFIFLVSSTLQIFMLCWHGNLIIESSNGISNAVYQGHWFNGNSKFKKTVSLILMRGQKPQTLSAYKFSVVSVQSFSTIMSTSFSYFTLLRTMYEPK